MTDFDAHVRAHRRREADALLNGFLPADNGTETSREAAERVAPHVTEQQRTILAALKKHGPMTRAEIAFVTGLKENSVNGRLSPGELANPLRPMVEPWGRRDGREVMGLTDHGIFALGGREE